MSFRGKAEQDFRLSQNVQEAHDYDPAGDVQKIVDSHGTIRTLIATLANETCDPKRSYYIHGQFPTNEIRAEFCKNLLNEFNKIASQHGLVVNGEPSFGQQERGLRADNPSDYTAEQRNDIARKEAVPASGLLSVRDDTADALYPPSVDKKATWVSGFAKTISIMNNGTPALTPLFSNAVDGRVEAVPPPAVPGHQSPRFELAPQPRH